MSLSESDVKHVAHLARLQILDEEIPVHADNLSKILDLVAQMSSADTDNVEPMAHPRPQSQPLRPDQVTEADVRDEMLQNAPASQDGLFLVPQVIE